MNTNYAPEEDHLSTNECKKKEEVNSELFDSGEKNEQLDEMLENLGQIKEPEEALENIAQHLLEHITQNPGGVEMMMAEHPKEGEEVPTDVESETVLELLENPEVEEVFAQQVLVTCTKPERLLCCTLLDLAQNRRKEVTCMQPVEGLMEPAQSQRGRRNT